MQVSKTLTQANYDIAVSLTTEDREGTFTSGSIDYEYDQRGKLGTALDVTLSPEWYAESATYDITINNHELSGWEITRIEYTATVDINIVVKNLFYSATTGGLIKGRVRVKLPDGAGGHQTYEETTHHDYVHTDGDLNQRIVEYKNILLSWADTTYLDGKIHPPIEVWCRRITMGLSTSQGITRYVRPSGCVGSGLQPGSAYQASLDQMGTFNTFSLGSSTWPYGKSQQPEMPDIAPRYAYDDQDGTYQLNIEAATDTADTLKEYGDKLFDVFDNYQPNFQYLGDNARVSDAQLQSRLGEASSDIRPMPICSRQSMNGICDGWA